MSRHPLALGRPMLREDGKVLWDLRRRIPLRGNGAYRRDATRAFVFDPMREPRAALAPRQPEEVVASSVESSRTCLACLAPSSVGG